MMKYNQGRRSIIFPLFDYSNIKFNYEFDPYTSSVAEEHIKINNPFAFSTKSVEYADWYIFRQILEKFTENQKT